MTTRPLVTAMAGVTISTAEPDHLCELLTDLTDWELLCEGAIDKDQEQLWGIDAGSAGNHYGIYCSRGATRGMIRRCRRHRARANSTHRLPLERRRNRCHR